MIVIVDYGMGNLHSVKRALDYAAQLEGKNINVKISAKADDILNASHLILPGQGGIKDCMKALQYSKLEHALRQAVHSKTPILGICVGMQMLFEQSEEGDMHSNIPTTCLGLISGKIKKFPQKDNNNKEDQVLKVPHMGWNTIDFQNKNGSKNIHKIWHNIPNNSHFYFIHSYYLVDNAENANYTIAKCRYGLEFVCAIACNNIVAMQFHPEKSARYGLQIYQNFINLAI